MEQHETAHELIRLTLEAAAKSCDDHASVRGNKQERVIAGLDAERIRAIDPAAILAQFPEAVPSEPGLYAIRYRDNWDGEGDICMTLADRSEDGVWRDHESGKELLQYQGDEILRAWPLNDKPEPVAVPEEVITKLAVQHFQIDYDRLPASVYTFARALLAAQQPEAQQPAQPLLPRHHIKEIIRDVVDGDIPQDEAVFMLHGQVAGHRKYLQGD